MEPDQTPPAAEIKAVAPKKPKRLTLQERLALAAKAKTKHAQDTGPTNTSDLSDSGTTPEPATSGRATPELGEKDPQATVTPLTEDRSLGAGESSPSLTPAVSNSETPAGSETLAGPETPAAPETSAGLEMPAGSETQSTPETSSKQDPAVSELTVQVESLKRQVKKLKEENISAKLRASGSEWDRKLAEKDKAIALNQKKLADQQKKMEEKELTIQQLMEEGQELSKKELKSNERIRTLVSNNVRLEASLKEYAEKNEQALLQLGEVEDLVKTHKLKSVGELLEVVAASNQKNAELQRELAKHTESNWDAKYRESQRLYERELEEKTQCRKELDEALVHLDLVRNQQRLELASKDKIIAKLTRETMAVQDENSTEISRLEAKIESLRVENESFLKYAQKPAEAGSTIDYKDYAKLSENHQNLQAQYVSSQENWKTIESTLLSKVESLASSTENLKKSKLKLSGELRSLHGELNAQADKIEALSGEVRALSDGKRQLQAQLEDKTSECRDLEAKAEELKAVFSTSRQNFELKIKNLTETVHKLESATYPASMSAENLGSLQTKRGYRESGLNLNLDFRNSRKISYNSLTNTPASVWEEPHMDGSRRNSMFEMPDSTSFTDEIYPQDASDYRDASISTPTGAGTGATKNIQLINKMSSTIRRLEVEIMTLKDENEHLTAEKEAAQHEIVSMSNVGARVAELEQEVQRLQRELEERGRREDTLLEVIGEKSEKVGELQADVADLKDLLRSQVQQMIEMREKT